MTKVCHFTEFYKDIRIQKPFFPKKTVSTEEQIRSLSYVLADLVKDV